MNSPKLPRQTFEPSQNTGQPKQDIYSPSLADVPYGAPQQPSQYSANSQTSRKSHKGLFILLITGVVIIGGLSVYALLAGGNKPAPKQSTSTNDTPQSQVLEPAQAIDVEQTNNSLSQDLSRLDDEKDLPNNSLEDTTLGL